MNSVMASNKSCAEYCPDKSNLISHLGLRERRHQQLAADAALTNKNKDAYNFFKINRGVAEFFCSNRGIL